LPMVVHKRDYHRELALYNLRTAHSQVLCTYFTGE